MRKMKKSLKIIISLVCVFAVAIASVVTAVVIHKRRKDNGGTPPSTPAYALTASQIELGKEISQVASTSVSSNKLQPLEYSEKLDAVLGVDKISYLDKSIAWSTDGFGGYTAYVLDSEGNPVELLTKTNEMNLVREGYYESKIDFMGKNHFSVLYKYSDTDFVRIVCSVEDGTVVLNKSFTLVDQNGYSKLNGDIFRIALDENYFVIMTETASEYRYEFYDYISDYSEYESFKLEVSDVDEYISCTNGVFYVGESMVAARIAFGEFGLIQDSDVSSISLKNATIVETKSELSEKTTNSELVDGKYYSYSYKFIKGNEEKEISLDGFTRISAVSYSGDKYFGLFVQGVDSENKLAETGTMIYFNYDLEVIAKYSANSAYTGRVMYSNDEVFLTGEGLVSGKSSSDCIKTYDFSKNDLEFVNILSTGNIILEDGYDNLQIYDLSMNKVLESGFDKVISLVDDEYLIYSLYDNYYRYNIKTKSAPVKINYESTDVTANTSMYFVKNDSGKFSLMSGSAVVKDEISSYETGDNYLTYYSNAEKTTLYFVDKNSVSNIADVSFTASAIYGGSSGSSDKVYGATADDEESIFDQDPEWYEYDDKVVYAESETDSTAMTYKFTHCIQNGYYSKTNYVDYLEIHYVGEGAGSGYLPYRIYYRVDIDDLGYPKIKIISKGHHRLAYKELTGTMTFDNNCIEYKGKFYAINAEYSLGVTGAPPTNKAYPMSYDYTEVSGGVTQYLYRYTDSTATADGSGLFFLEEGRVCSAEVYGNSIRVSIYFDFKYTSQQSGQTNNVAFSGNCVLKADADTDTGYEFNKSMLLSDKGAVEADYYNSLYYQTVVIGVKDENKNFYTDIIGMPESSDEAKDGLIVTDYFVDDELKSIVVNNDCYNMTLGYDESTSSYLFNACVSAKTYINDPSNIQSMFLGGNLFKTNMVGAQLVGITSPREFNHQNITIKSLYDTSVTSGSRNYYDDMLEFRLIPLGATSANGEANADSIVESKYIYYDETAQSYKVAFDNTDYIYTAGGLNRFRYVYCLFEPQTFYVNVDYNASGAENSFGNEIDYLQSYLGLSIGLDYRNDYVNYNKSWVYRNVEEEDFGDYNNENNDKYYPYDFTNVETRQEVIDLTDKTTAQIADIRKNNENSAKVRSYVKENEKYFYINIDGVRYYFQKNFYDETVDYSKPYSYMFEENSFDGSYYFVAYKNISDLEEATAVELFGKYLTINENEFYTEDEKYLEEDIEDFGIYKANVEKIYIRIPNSTAADGSFDAYYHEINVHQRDDTKVVYDGYYSFNEDSGEVIVPTSPDSTKQYSISETFSFLYTDNILLTRLPQHTHYDFTGWKVSIPRADGTVFEYIVSMESITSSGINVNTNMDNTAHPFLPEYEGADGTTGVFYALWKKITEVTVDDKTTTVISWLNTIDNPITITAQWQPKQCNVEAVLYVKDGTKYNGLEYEVTGVGSGYTLTPNFNIANNATNAPVFKKGTENLDQKSTTGATGADGILDFSEETEFEYGKYQNFAQIGSLMLTNGFSQTLINTTGLSCQFIGWAFHNKDGNYVSIINSLDPLAETTLINEYIGDTTTITIYAYYTVSRYNFFLRFHSMGGATLDGGTKNYYSDYNYTTGVTGNGQIFNAVRNPAVYQIELKDSTSTIYSKSYCTGCGNNAHTHNTLELNGSSYGVDIKDETNPFYVGNSVEIKITLNDEYYTKKIVFNNIVLRNDSYGGYSQYLDIFDLTFTYTYSDSGAIWEGEAVSKISGYTLPVTASSNGVFKIGNGSQNDNNNKFTITQTGDSITIAISNLSYPGVLQDYNAYKNQTLTGIDGFTLNVYPESYTIETEKVEIYAKDENDEDVAGPFNNNNAIMISSQPLTNIEGREPETSQPAYIWLGTSKYMFLNSWNTNQLSGYYLMSSDGATNAVIYNSYTYEQFIRQKITINENIFVYYDSKEHRIYYPAQYSSTGNAIEYQTPMKLTSSGHRWWFEIDGVTYYVNLSSSNTDDDTLTESSTAYYNAVPGYYYAYTNKTSYFTGDGKAYENYNNSDYYYSSGRSRIVVYFDCNTKTVTYRAVSASEFAIGYNNTRVLAIDPEQEQVYMSNSPTHSVATTQYELKYYLSSMTVGGTTISFNKLTRDTLTYYTDANGSIKTYGLLRTTTSVNVGSAFERREGVYSKNNSITEKLANGTTLESGDTYNVISFLGKQYIIQDAYKLKISAETGKVGATEYYFYLTRSEDGYTKYFLIYDECTTNMSDLKKNYSIKLTFKELNRNLTIVAEEEDLYDASNRSFEVSYAETYRKYTNGVGDSLKYQFDNDNLFGNVIENSNFDFNGNTFYEVDTDGDDTPLSSKITNKSIRDITSLTWQSSYEFTPSTNRRLKISAKSGYIIKYIKVYVGTKAYTNSAGTPVPDNYINIMTFNFIDSSLDDLYHYPTNDNYSFSSVNTNTSTLISYIGYNIENSNVEGTSLGNRTVESNIAYGYKLLQNETYGLYYSNFYDTSWAIGEEDTLYFDHLYLMLSGMFEDIKIEFATTSYSEYLFESGETDTNKNNPLINEETFTPSESDIVYEEIDLSETYLNLYTMKYDTSDPDKLVLDETLLNENKYTDKNGDEQPIFTIRYYHKNSINNIYKNTLRVIFFGTGSKIKHGVHFMATHQDYSVYFTNGRYYNEPLGSTSESAFKNLESYSGRTTNNNPITEATRNGTNKLVYMFTGALHEEDDSGNYTGFFVNSSYIVANESNFKFFMATKVFVNKIGVRTDSYLYNHVLTSDSSNRDEVTYSNATTLTGDIEADDYIGKAVSYGYPQANPDYEIVLKEGSQYFHYQLDTTHKKNSWFNDTVLSNIQLFSYLDNEADALPKTWANRVDSESELTRVEMGGLNFNWKYYDIAGYYLKYIMIKIADIDTYFVIDLAEIIVDNTIADGDTKFLKTIRIYNPDTTNARSYDYRFNLYYHKESNYGYYQLYPVLLTDDTGEIDIFNSVSLMANDIYVSFISNAYTYTVNFYNHSDVGSASSTISSLQYRVGSAAYSKVNTSISEALATKEIYYDSMITLDVSQKMTGYSFIGWGSENYYDGSSYYSRFRYANNDYEINTWYSSSVWFDNTRFFPNAGGYYDADYQAAVAAGEEYALQTLSAQENIDLYLSLLNKYNGASSMPGGAFYASGSYFMTDTGYKNKIGSNDVVQNYNFYADYISIFSKHMSQAMSELQNQSNVSQGRIINLYGIWKANTYAIEYDVNNSKGDTFYVDYSLANEEKLFAYEFTSDKIGFRNVAKTELEIQNRVTRLCYVVFDTNLWYSLSGKGDILMYSAMQDPYTISDLYGTSAVSLLSVDMFGYSWLGWYYSKLDDINQGTALPYTTRVFDSYYSNQKNASTLTTVPVFNKSFMDIMISAGTVFEFDGTGLPDSQKFTYYGMHKATTGLNPIDGYVCFYDYSYKSTNGNASKTHVISANSSFNYVQTIDYLNTFRISGTGETAQILYSGTFTDSIVLSYYDTFMSSNCYAVRINNDKYSLTLTTNAQDVRRIKLFANWSQNKYTVKVDNLDNSGSTTIYKLGSSSAENMFTSGGTYWFNSTALMSDLMNKTQPTRIGYDFLGWSFNYIPPLEGSTYQSLISSINAPNQYLYLCKEMLAAYASLNGASGTDDLESNALMIDGNRITGTVGTSWILNESGKAERLGDSEVDNTRYVYLFPIWKVQTFSINISLNISAQSLKNLHEKDSSFAIALYDSSKEDCSKAAGVNSNYFTFNKTESTVIDQSKYYYYYNDIVANVNFEIEFDQLFSTATCSFAGRTYYLKDLMMTSAGYYFMGLMIDNYALTATNKDYVVRNLLRTTLELNGYVHHDDDEEELTETSLYNNDSYLKYENITGNTSEEPDVFDLSAYNKLVNSKFSYSGSNPVYNHDGGYLSANNYVSFTDGYGTYKNSSNFGTLNFSAYIYGGATTKSRKFNIMSERDGSDYYLYIIHNNVKYYVVYYVSTGSSSTAFKDVITSDRTYLYYNVKDANGNVLNRYIIRFSASGEAYYVDNTFGNKNIIYLRVALYTAKTNKLNLSISGSSSTIVSYGSEQTDGSLTGGNLWYSGNYKKGNIYLIGSGNYELNNSASREFTLFADWETRSITSTIVNGNNATVYNEETETTSKQTATSDNNPGLAGYYDIKNPDDGNSVHSTDDVEGENRISFTYDFYSDIDHSLLPFYGGRYLSELTIEFDTIVEEGSTDSTSYKMRHNTIVFKFEWSNTNYNITISGVTLNGITVNSAVTTTNYSSYKLNTISGIDILSYLDYYSLNSGGAGIRLYEKDQNTIDERAYINRVNVNLDNVMNSVKFTCKYSIQTYLVEVYSIVADTDLSSGYVTAFGSITQMEQSSNKAVENRGLYGPPYQSNVDFAAGAIPTISTDCAKKLESYNVPFYYFVTNSSELSNARSNYNSNSSKYGLNYIYGGLYTSGTSSSTIGTSYGDLDELLISGYNFRGWFSNPNDSGSTVRLYEYSQATAITKNTTIYGYYVREDAPTKVLFYYWDDNQNKYIQYTNNEKDYMTGGGCISGNKITKLPSPSIAPWYGDEAKHFIGYIYITNEIYGQFVASEINEDYDSLKYNSSNTFTETRGDIYSAFYMNRLDSTLHHNNIENLKANYIDTLSLPDMFANRLVVHDNKYFTKNATVNGRDVKVLDGVRLEVEIAGGYKIIKDFKMLNIDTELPNKQTVHAIPIYEEFTLQLHDIYTYEDTAIITSNTNMIESNVFETNANYTIYYDPRDVKVAVSTSSGLNLQNITDATTYTLQDVKNPSGQTIFDYKQREFTLGGSNKYVYVYYLKSDGKTPFYMSNYVVAKAGQDATVEIKVNEYNSPLEIELTGAYLEHYRKAFQAIEEDSSISSDVVKVNRQLVIYILLQLKQSYTSALSSQTVTVPIYYASDGSKPDTAVNDSSNKYSISETIRALNYKKLGIYDSNFVATTVNYDSFSLYRLAYSLAYYYVKENNINDCTGLKELFGSSNMNSTYAGYTEDTSDIVNNVMNVSTFSNNSIKPGDIMASYRHNTTLSKKTIYNIVTSENKTVYAYDSFNEGEIDASATFAMYLYKDTSYIYVYDSAYGVVSIALSDYNNTDFQEDDKYKKFYHGTNDDITYDNEKETGYYTLNASIRVEEAVLDTSGEYDYYYFKYNGSNTPYIRQGSYYYNKSSFETKWTAYQEQAKKYDEYLDNRDAWTSYNAAKEAWDANQAAWAEYRTKLAAWEAVEKQWSDYYAELAEWNSLSAEEKEGKTAPTAPTTARYSKPTEPAAEWAEPTKPSKTISEPTKPDGYVRNSSSTESVARTYVANNYDDFSLTRYYIKSEGPARYFAYYSNGNQHSSYKKYYMYYEGREYYELANENDTDSRQEASSYGTGWDGSKTSNNYWLIYNNGTRIYSRWDSFF